MPEILLVKTSSLGDVVHNLPVVQDILDHYPEARIDWLVEDSFAGIPRLHPGVRQVLPVAVRRWRTRLWHPQVWRELGAARAAVRAHAYDLVIDTQGLLKSACLASWSTAPRCGYDRASIREPLAALSYHKRYPVARDLHAVERNRLLVGRALGYVPDAVWTYGLQADATLPAAITATDQNGVTARPYVVLLHATSRADKQWPSADWVALGRQLQAQGLGLVLPWGSSAELAASQALAAALPGAWVPPRLSIADVACLLRGARLVVGVDTGLVHLAAALATPVVALYLASSPELTGVHTLSLALNLGRRGAPPQVEAVAQACRIMLQAGESAP